MLNVFTVPPAVIRRSFHFHFLLGRQSLSFSVECGEGLSLVGASHWPGRRAVDFPWRGGIRGRPRWWLLVGVVVP